MQGVLHRPAFKLLHVQQRRMIGYKAGKHWIFFAIASLNHAVVLGLLCIDAACLGHSHFGLPCMSQHLSAVLS